MHIIVPKEDSWIRNTNPFERFTEPVRVKVQLQNVQPAQMNLQGGIMQYAREPSDIDTAIFRLRHKDIKDFLTHYATKLKTAIISHPELQIDMQLLILYSAVIVYPQTISLTDVEQYVSESVKQFVPSTFMQEIPLFENSENIIMDFIQDEPTFVKPTLKEFKESKIDPDCATLIFDDEDLQYGLDMHQYILEKHAEVVQFAIDNPDIISDSDDVMQWVLIGFAINQRSEILEIYFEKLIAIDLLKRVYRNNSVNLYLNNTDLLALPIEKDPFLQNLDQFLKESMSNRQENFYEHDPETELQSYNDSIPESLQCKAITQLFFDTTAVIDPDMLLYGFICGQHNQTIMTRQIHVAQSRDYYIIPIKKEPTERLPIQYINEIDNQVNGTSIKIQYALKSFMHGFNPDCLLDTDLADTNLNIKSDVKNAVWAQIDPFKVV